MDASLARMERRGFLCKQASQGSCVGNLWVQVRAAASQQGGEQY